MSILDIGAGASTGLESLLARYQVEDQQELRRRQQTEIERANRSDENLRREANSESAKLRQLQLESLSADRAARDADRDRVGTQATLNMRAIGTELDPATYQHEIQTGAPPDFYDVGMKPDPAAVAEGVPPALAQNDPRGPTIAFKGVRSAQEAEARAKAAEDRAAATDAARAVTQEQADRRIAQADERERRIASQPPITLVFDPNSPTGTRVATRGEGIGSAGPPGAATQTQINANKIASDQLADLKKMFDEGARDLVGPAEGRARSFSQNVPDVLLGMVGAPTSTDPNQQRFADFKAASSGFRNAVIKAITGAQMSEREADRIMSQIPLETDKPDVWMAKAEQSAINVARLEQILREKQGNMGGAAPPTGAGAAPPGTRRRQYDPATGQLK